MAKFTYEL